MARQSIKTQGFKSEPEALGSLTNAEEALNEILITPETDLAQYVRGLSGRYI